MIRRLLVALAALLTISCARPKPSARPDVVLVTIDRFRFEELAPWAGEARGGGGSVQAPHLARFAEQAHEFVNAATLSPDAAPAALTVLTGTPPSQHGLRFLDEGHVAPSAQTLADRLKAAGWETGAFLQTDEITSYSQADRGFEAWDGPAPGFPTGHPGAAQQRGTEDTIASGLHWLLRAPQDPQRFLWIQLAEPAPPVLAPDERASRLGEIDRLLGALLESAQARGEKRGAAPILIICPLSSHGPDATQAPREAFLLDAAALRVHVLVSAPGLKAGKGDRLFGLDELAMRIELLARTGRTLPPDEREVVVAQTTVPLTCCDAEPEATAVGRSGDARPSDPQVASTIAADAGWPGGRGRRSASDAASDFLALDAAWSLARRGRTSEAVDAFAALVASQPSPAARAGYGLALASANRAQDARAQFAALASEAQAGTLAWTQARIGEALTARAMGDVVAARAAVAEILATSPDDLRALTLQADVADAAGDRDGAVAAIRSLLEKDPDNSFALAELGRLQLASGHAREGADALTAALARRPTHPQLLLATADALAAAGDWWSAMDRLDTRDQLYGPSPESDLVRARCWRDTGRWSQAAAAFRKVTDARPQDARARLGLAEALLRSGREDEGRAEWARAKDLAPQDPAPCAVLRAWAASVQREGELAAAGCQQ